MEQTITRLNPKIWPFHSVLAILQIPVFFMFFHSRTVLPSLVQTIALSVLLCLCCLYKATGVLGSVFVAILYLKPLLFRHYSSILSSTLLSSSYWLLVQTTHPYPGALLDRLVLFLLACLGAQLCSPLFYDHCAAMAVSTLTVSLTDGLVRLRAWFTDIVDPPALYCFDDKNGVQLDEETMKQHARYRWRRRFLAKVRVLMITILVSVLLKMSVNSTKNESQSIMSHLQQSFNSISFAKNSQFHSPLNLTTREVFALLMTLLIAVHLAARELLASASLKSMKKKLARFVKDVKSISLTIRRERSGVDLASLESQVPTEPHRVSFDIPGDSAGNDTETTSLMDSVNSLVQSVIDGQLNIRSAEKQLENSADKVLLRRVYLSRKLGMVVGGTLTGNDMVEMHMSQEIASYYDSVEGKCCENVYGFIPIPLGYVGPLKVNGQEYMVPLATTEGALLASTARGCKLLTSTKTGVSAYVVSDHMTRGPVFETSCLQASVILIGYIRSKQGHDSIKRAFESTSRYARLLEVKVRLGTSTRVFVKMIASTGDAMGMNMLSKGTEKACAEIVTCVNQILTNGQQNVRLVALSGNFCVDKKPSVSNWLDGRGKSVVAEACIPSKLIAQQLKITNPEDLKNINLSKNIVGSAMGGSQPGAGCNAQAANVVAAFFAACGQDLGQVVSSSACLTWFDYDGDKDLIRVSVTMPCVEVGTVGGGTVLRCQRNCLAQMGLAGASEIAGSNARQLACVLAGTVMAAELSLLAALCTNDLVKAHMALNR